MRCIGLVAVVCLSCSGPGGQTPPSSPARAPAARPRLRPRPPAAPATRKPPRPRPHRPRQWVAQLQGRVQAAPLELKGTGHLTALVAAGRSLVTAAGDRDGTGTWLRGWDASRRKGLWTLKAPSRRAALRLAADGKSMLVTTPAGTNHVYRLGADKPRAYRRWKRKRGRNKGRTQGLSADGKMLVRGDVRAQVRGYTLDKYKMKWLVKGKRVLMSRDGRVAAVVRGKQVRLVDAVTGRGLGLGKTWKLAGTLVGLAVHSRDRWAQILRRGQACELRVTGQKPRAVGCVRDVHLAWSPAGTLLGYAGHGVATVIRVSDGRVLSTHRSCFWAPLRVAFPSDTTFVLANETGGQLSFYRLVRR